MPLWHGFFLILGGAPRFYPNFTDKQAFSSDLSVNFWPFWWGFTDKAGFLGHLSVKPGPKRLNFYGQTAIFDHFVRNRHFWNSPFTDSMPIFIDSSVNEILPNAVLLKHCTWVRLRAKRRFLRFARYLRSQCFGESKRVEHFFSFLRFCSTFEAARSDFGAGGRTFFQFFEILFYFQSRAGRIWSRR